MADRIHSAAIRLLRRVRREGAAAAGLVERMPSERDRRSVTVHPTEAGRELMRAGRARRVERLAGQLDGLAADDLRTLDRAAAILARLQQSA